MFQKWTYLKKELEEVYGFWSDIYYNNTPYNKIERGIHLF